MRKILLLPAVMALGIAGCSIDPSKPIDFPSVNTMYATYKGPQLWVSNVEFVSAMSVMDDVKAYAETKGRRNIEKSISRTSSSTLTDNSNQVLKRYLAETGRFMMAESLSDTPSNHQNLITDNLAFPLTIDAALVKLSSRNHGDQIVDRALGEPMSVTKDAVIHLVVKDRLGNILYVAEGKATANSADTRSPQMEYLDDYVVNNALLNAVNDLSRAMDQGHIGHRKY